MRPIVIARETRKPIIAIVDDDKSVCRAVKRLIQSFGMEADTFASGQELIDRLEASPGLHLDCILLDLHMPNLNGLEVQERLARSGLRSPIIFITAHDDEGARAQALAGGAFAFLRKPFNDEMLRESLRDALQRSAGESEDR